LKFGTLPHVFEMTMSMFGSDWAILETDFLRGNLKGYIWLTRVSIELG
jgi:hypothetical protein